MAVILHHSRRRDGDEPRHVVIQAILTVLFVTAIVAAALGAATYVVSRALVGLMS